MLISVRKKAIIRRKGLKLAHSLIRFPARAPERMMILPRPRLAMIATAVPPGMRLIHERCQNDVDHRGGPRPPIRGCLFT